MNLILLVVLGELTGLIVSLPFAARYLKGRIKGEILEEIRELKESIIKNPDALVKEFGPVIQSFMADMMKEGSKVVEGGVPMIKLPIIGKVPASIIQPFLQQFLGKRLGLSSNEEPKNPFG